MIVLALLSSVLLSIKSSKASTRPGGIKDGTLENKYFMLCRQRHTNGTRGSAATFVLIIAEKFNIILAEKTQSMIIQKEPIRCKLAAQDKPIRQCAANI